MPFKADDGPNPEVHISRRAGVALILSFALLLVAGFAALLLNHRARVANDWVAHTVEVRQQARELTTLLITAQSGMRGYLLAADPVFLEDFEGAVARVSGVLGRLRALTEGNAAQAAAVDEIARLSERLIDFFGDAYRLAESGRHDEAVGLVRAQVGKALMDDVRSQTDRFSIAELHLLTERQAASERLNFWTLAFVFTALLGAMLLAALLTRSMLHFVNRLARQSAELERETRLRRQSEATLVQVQKMEAVGQLAGGIAHDFNNMLTIVLGNLDTVRRRLAKSEELSGPASAVTGPIDLAIQGARSAARLTHRLLAFSRRQALAPRQVDLNRVVTEMTELVRRTIGENVELEAVLAPGLWRTFADVNQLENALVNLVVNARDAMPDGGRVTIETANVYLDAGYTARFGEIEPGQYVLLSVADTGSGIAPELMGHVFEPFFTTKAAGEGSGLGLAMVHGFVRQSGGHIRVYSEPGLGTAVKLYLPRLAGAVAEAVAERADPAAGSAGTATGTVLLVEDNDGVRDYARSALEEAGLKVLEARDARTALALADGGAAFDLLFTDVVLGSGPNGRELADALRRGRPALPVLFTSGYTRNAIMHAGRLDPGVDLLEKPFTQQELAARIRDLLDRGRGVPEGAPAPAGLTARGSP